MKQDKDIDLIVNEIFWKGKVIEENFFNHYINNSICEKNEINNNRTDNDEKPSHLWYSKL